MSRFGRTAFYPALFLTVAGLAGCSPKVNSVQPPKEWFNIIYVATAYSEAESRLGHAPKNVEEIKPFLQKFGNPDELLVSPNDGLPFVVNWGNASKGSGYSIVAYEQKGKDGKRQIIDTRVMPWKMSDEEFTKRSLATPAVDNKSSDKAENGK